MIEILTVIVLSLSPISELRGAIPVGVSLGLDPFLVLFVSILFNSLVFFPIYFGLNFFYGHLQNLDFFRNIVEKARKKGHKILEKYGYIGLIPFVAIPLPVTGAWTGTLIAWLFDLTWWKAFLAILIGVIIAGLLVFTATLGIISIFF